MQNTYIEHIVARKDPAYAPIAKVGLLVLVMLSLLLAITSLYGILVLIVVGLGAYWAMLNLRVEYEYLYMEGSFSADKILNRSRRKKLVDTDKAELLMIAPWDSTEARDAMGGQCKQLDLSSRRAGQPLYAYVFQKGGERKALKIEPTEEMLKQMRYFTPSKVKIN